MSENIRTLSGRLKALKGWLTQTISACANLIGMPRSIANDSFLRNRIEISIQELDNRLGKINDCLSELEACELSVQLDDDRKLREESYKATRAQVASAHQDCLNRLVRALAELDTLAEANTATQPAVSDDQRLNGGASSLKVQDSLKPFVLSKEHSVLEFSQWKKEFRAFYSASKLEKLDISGQQAFFRKYIESNLLSVLETKITRTTTVFNNDNAPGTDSCFQLLEDEFQLRYPLVARRFQLFSIRQARGETFTEYMAKIKTMATHCGLESLGVEGLLIYISIVGLNSTDFDLREKLLELPTLTMNEVDRVSRGYESAQSAIRGISSAFANLATTHEDDFHQSVQQVSTSSAGTKWQQLQKLGRCPRCAQFRPDHSPAQCRAVKLSCDLCFQKGHLRRACGKQRQGPNKGQQRQPWRQRTRQQGQQRTRSPRRPPTSYKREKMNRQRNFYDNSRSPSPNRGRRVTTENDSCGSSESGNEDSRSLVRAVTNFCHTPPPVGNSMPTPRIKIHFTLTNGKSFDFLCVPDTGATYSIVSAKVISSFGIPLQNTKERLYNASKSQMKVVGVAQLKAKFKSEEIWIDALACSDLPGSEILLSWKDLERLRAITIAYKVSNRISEKNPFYVENDSEAKIKQDFKDVLSDKLNSKPMLIGGPMTIRFKDDIKIVPYKVFTAPAVPLHLEKEAKNTLDTAVDDGVIAKVPINENSGWCFRSFFVTKPNTSKLRLIVDMSPLNSVIERPAHVFKPASEVLKSLNPKSTCFAKMDATQGYFQVKLDEESSKICTFITCWGKFKYLRAPMGCNASSGEYLQRTDEALANVAHWCHKLVDDLLIESPDMPTLYQRIRECLTQCRRYNITISLRKFQIARETESVIFAGQVVSSLGISADPSKLDALRKFKQPENCSDIKSFLGVAQQLASFSPDLAYITAPLRLLLKKDTKFLWTSEINDSFEKTKRLIASDQILKPYDPSLKAELYCDASRLALGFVLVQKSPQGQIRVIQCGSKSLDDTQSRYSIIELEMLSILFAVNKCRFYLLGSHFLIFSDHKPLIAIMVKSLHLIENSKLRRIREKLAEYSFSLHHVVGIKNVLADYCSRHPVWDKDTDADIFEDVVESSQQVRLIDSANGHLGSIDPLLQDLKLAADADLSYQQVIKTLIEGKLPQQTGHTNASRQYKEVWDRLGIFHGLLILDNSRIVIPASHRSKILQLLHRGHLGIVKSKMLAKQLYYWPNINKELTTYVTNCSNCMEFRASQPKETQLHYHSTFPWELLHADLFETKGTPHIAIVDDFSGMLFSYALKNQTTAAVVETLSDLFLYFSYPCKISTDNGGCFRKSFGDFCKTYGINHVTSSPYHHEKAAESAVFNAKQIAKKSQNSRDFQEQLLCFRLAPRKDGFSPADLFFGRSLKYSRLPTHPNAQKRDLTGFQIAGKSARDKMKKHAGIESGGRDLAQLAIGSRVIIQNTLTKNWDKVGHVTAIRDSGRSYEISIPGKKPLVRNRIFLRQLDKEGHHSAETADCPDLRKLPLRRSKRLAMLANDVPATAPAAVPAPAAAPAPAALAIAGPKQKIRKLSFGTKEVITYKPGVPVDECLVRR